jgi:hypothetical protein
MYLVAVREVDIPKVKTSRTKGSLARASLLRSYTDALIFLQGF